MDVLNADPDFESMISTYCKGIIREKLCETIPYRNSLSYRIFCADTTDYLKNIYLRQILENDMEDEEIGRQVWLAEGKNNSKFTVTLTYLKEIAENITYYEHRFNNQK